MARIRTLKPEFWTDEKIGDVSMPARLLLIGALNFADDHGGLDRSSKQLKAQIFPYDTIDCEPLVLELVHAGLLVEYQVADGKYLHIKGFQKHQKVDHPSKFPKTPPYDGSSSSPRESSSNTADESDKEENTQGALESPREPSLSSHSHRGIEGKGIEGNTKNSSARARDLDNRETETEIHAHVESIKSKYPKAARADWIAAEKHIRNLVRDGTPWELIEAGVERYAAYCRATNRLVQNPALWFCAIDRPWLQDWDLPKTKTETRLDSNVDVMRQFVAGGS